MLLSFVSISGKGCIICTWLVCDLFVTFDFVVTFLSTALGGKAGHVGLSSHGSGPALIAPFFGAVAR